jgi:hypothetical protein
MKMTFDPTTNRVPMGLLTKEEREILKSAKHGWECWKEHSGEWDEDDNPLWIHYYIYRAKPAPVVKSVWVNVYPLYGFEHKGMYLSPSCTERRKADDCAKSTRIGVARFDLIDGVLSVELETLEKTT